MKKIKIDDSVVVALKTKRPKLIIYIGTNGYKTMQPYNLEKELWVDNDTTKIELIDGPVTSIIFRA